MPSPAFRSLVAGPYAAAQTTVTPTKPAGAANGDIVLLHLWLRSTTVTPTAPQWTAIRDDTDATDGYRIWTFWRREDGTAYSAITLSGTADALASTLAASGAAASGNPIDGHGGQNNAASTNWTAPSISPATLDTLLVYFVLNNSGAGLSSAPATFTLRTGGYNLFATKAQAAAGATGAVTGTGSSSIRSIGQLVAIRSVELAIPLPPRRASRGLHLRTARR